jgi:hypothetical protein
VIALVPASTWTTYRSPQLGFSFDYPANWRLNQVASSNLIVENYDPESGRPENPDALSIGIEVSPTLCDYARGNLEEWHSNVLFLHSVKGPLERLRVSNLPAIRFTMTGASEPFPMIDHVRVMFGKGVWLYELSASPLSSKQMPVFDRIVSSFYVQ